MKSTILVVLNNNYVNHNLACTISQQTTGLTSPRL